MERFLAQRILLSVIELGGYPDFSQLYRQCGFEAMQVNSVRKARNMLKQTMPDVIVAEFNFQSDFRDRTSSMETLMASLENLSKKPVVIIFYEQEFKHQFAKLQSRFVIDHAISFPIDSQHLSQILQGIKHD